MRHCSADQAWHDVVFAAVSSSPKTISGDSIPSSSSPRLADVNETWTGRRCGQTYGEEDERGSETRGKGEDKEMMTTVGDGGARPCHISHWAGGAAVEARCDLSEHNSSLRSDWEVDRGGEEAKKWRCLIPMAILVHLPPPPLPGSIRPSQSLHIHSFTFLPPLPVFYPFLLFPSLFSAP